MASIFSEIFKTTSDVLKVISYGEQKKDGSHSHIYNTGKDRTTHQKLGDKKRRGPRK